LRKGSFKTRLENATKRSTSGPGLQDQHMTMEKSWVIMKNRTDKEHEEYRGSLFHKWGMAYGKERFATLRVNWWLEKS